MRTRQVWARSMNASKDTSSGPALTALDYSPLSNCLWSTSGGRVVIVNVKNGEFTSKSPARDAPIRALSLNAAGTLCAVVAGRDVVLYDPTPTQFSSYAHLSDVTCVQFNHITGDLVSGSRTELCFTTASTIATTTNRSVDGITTHRVKVASPVSALCWSADGRTLAAGLISGIVSFYDATGTELGRYTTGGAVSTLTAVPLAVSEGQQIICAGSWDSSLHFISATTYSGAPPPGMATSASASASAGTGSGTGSGAGAGAGVGAGDGGDDLLGDLDTHLGQVVLPFLPTVAAYSPCGDLYLGGTNNQISLFAGLRELVPVAEVGVWVRALVFHCRHLECNISDDSDSWLHRNVLFSYATQTGRLNCAEAQSTMVHALYGGRYVCRARLTSLTVSQLDSTTGINETVTIDLGAYVCRVSVYNDIIAVLLPDQIAVLRSSPGALDYKITRYIPFNESCSLLCATADYVIACQRTSLTAYSAVTGEIVRTWQLPAIVTYLLLLGGQPGSESLLAGLGSGSVYRITINRPTISHLITHSSAIRCIDMSPDRTKLGIVDACGEAVGYSLTSTESTDTSGTGGTGTGSTSSAEVLFRLTNAAAVAFSSQLDGVCIVTGTTSLFVVVVDSAGGAAIVHEQPSQGFVVSVSGSRAFCFRKRVMRVVDIPLAPVLRHFVASGAFAQAEQLAAIGSSRAEWRFLGEHALAALNFDTARTAFTAVGDLQRLALIDTIETVLTAAPAADKPRISAQVLARIKADIALSRSEFALAASLFLDAGQPQRAAELVLYAPKHETAAIRDAIKAANAGNLLPEISLQQGRALEATGDALGAADAFMAAGHPGLAVAALANAGLLDALEQLARDLPRSSPSALRAAAGALAGGRRYAAAADLWLAAGDATEYAKALCACKEFAVALEYAEGAADEETRDLIYVEYARYLVSRGDLTTAQDYYRIAGRPDEAVAVLTGIIRAEVSMRRWNAAACAAMLAAQAEDGEGCEGRAVALRRAAMVYVAYAEIDATVRQPFSRTGPAGLLGAAAVVLGASSQERPGLDLAGFGPTVAPGASTATAAQVAAQAAVQLGDGPALARAAALLPPRARSQILPAAALAFADDLSAAAAAARGACAACDAPLGPLSNQCTSCGATVLRSPVSWMPLPLSLLPLPADLACDPVRVATLCTAPPQGDAGAARSVEERIRDTEAAYLYTITHGDFISVYQSCGAPGDVRSCAGCGTLYSVVDYITLQLGPAKCVCCGSKL